MFPQTKQKLENFTQGLNVFAQQDNAKILEDGQNGAAAIEVKALSHNLAIQATVFDHVKGIIEEAVDLFTESSNFTMATNRLKDAAMIFRAGLWPKKFQNCMARANSYSRIFHSHRYNAMKRELHEPDNFSVIYCGTALNTGFLKK
jgi:hypothetical protein